MPIATRAFRNFGNRNGGLGGNPEWQSHLDNLGGQGAGYEFTLRAMRSQIDAGESLSQRFTSHTNVLSDSVAASDALTFASPGLFTTGPVVSDVGGGAAGLTLAYGGGLSLASTEMLATMGLGDIQASKLQAGLAELFVESQMQLAGLSGAARDAALAGFQSTNSQALLAAGMVSIDAVAANGDGAGLLAQLEALGMQRGASWGAMAGGLIPVDAIDDMANLGLLAFARPVYAATNVGLVTSQNDQQMQTDDLRTAHPGIDGSGIIIGVLSDSFNTRTAPITNYAQDVTNGDLPAGVTILADAPSARSDEGRGMAQLAFDIAPGAQFKFYTAFVSMADFANGIVALANAGADIIVDDIRYFAEPFFQDGILNQAVNTAYDLGAMYFSSAGNYASRSYEAAFVNSGQTFVNGAVTYTLHDFDPGAGIDTRQSVTQSAPASGNAVNYILQWDQPFFSIDPTSGGSANDVALIFRSGASVLAVVDATHVGNDPIELAGFNGSGTLDISIGVRAGANPGLIKYVTIGGNSFTVNEFATNSGTSYGHSNADHAIAVGAADWFDSPEFGQTPPLSENFSSRGGVGIYFDPDGTRLGSPVFRDHVEFTAGDGGNTSFFSSDSSEDADTFPNFFGTSAAAPNAAAMAALLMEMFPTATRTQIELAMKASAIDIQNDWAGGVTGVGTDPITGTGLVQAPAAAAALQAILDALPNGTGSIAIIAYNTGQSDGSGNPPTVDALRFVALEAIAAGTVIYFTDRTWNGTSFAAGASDGVATYTVGGGGLAAGQTVNLTGAALGTLNPEEAVDTIYAYQGTTPDAPVQFLYAIEIGDGNTTFSGSLANTGLVNGVTAVAVGLDSASYQGPTTEAHSHLFNGESLLENISDFANWEGDNRSAGGVNALDHPDHNGPYFTAPDISIWSAGTGGGDGIMGTHGDSTVTGGFNLNQLYTLDNEDLADTLVAPRDIVFDTVRGLFFIADSNLAGGTNRILQGNISDLLGNPGTAPPLTVLYTSNQNPAVGAGIETQIFNLELDSNSGIVYFTHGQRFEKINYNTAGQTSTVLANFGAGSGNPNGSTNNFIDDFVINFATGDVYLTSHRVTAASDGDIVSRNYLYHITGLDAGDGTGAFTFGGGNISVMNFSPDDDDSGLDTPAPGEAFPQEEGTLEGLALSANGQTLYFTTASTLFDHDADGSAVTPPQLQMGGVFSYSLVGNPTGTYTQIYQQVAGSGPRGLLDDLEVDPVSGRLYFTDITGVSGTVVNDGEGIWQIDPNGSNLLFFQSISNINSLTASSVFLNRAPTVSSSTQATPTSTEVAGLNSGFSNLVQPFTALDVTDADSSDQINQLGGAVIRISSGFQSGASHQDRLTINGATSGVLDFGSQDITYSYNSATGVMLLTGASTFNNYESAIALVRYSVSGDNPTNYGANLTRTISWAVSDGLDHSDEVSTTVTVAATNDAPANTVPGSESGVEDAPAFINGIQIGDVDADPTGQNMTVTLAVGRGTLTVNGAVPGGLTGADITGNGTATVVLTGTQAEINATLANATAVQFSLGTNGNGTALLTVTTSDNGNTGAPGALTDIDSFTITVSAVNDAPTVAGDGTESLANIFEDTHPAGTSVNTLLLGQYSDAADNQSAFPGGSSAGAFSGIAVIANGSTLATGQWQWSPDGTTWTSIGSVTAATARLYTNTIQIRFDPAANFNGPAPTLTVRLIDNSLGFGIVNGQVVDISAGAAVGGTTAYSSGTVVISEQVDPVNDAPTITALNTDAATWTEGAAAALLDVGSNAVAADIDSLNFDTGTLTVAITGALAEDGLFIGTVGTVTTGAGTVSVSGTQIGTFTGGGFGGGPLVITFDPDATPAAVTALLHAISYNNGAGDNPTGGTRTVTWTLVDGDGVANGGTDTASATTSVNVVAVNDAPAGTDHTAVVLEDGSYTFAAADFGYSDVDGSAFSGVRFTTLPALGTIFLDTDGPGGGAPVAVSAGTIVALSEITAGHVYYVPAANGNGAGYSSFTFQVRDNGGTLNGGLDLDQSPNTFTFDVTSVNDAPTQSGLNGDIATWTEGDGAVLLDVGSNLALGDIDSANFDGGTLTVLLSGGVIAQDGLFINAVGDVTSDATTVSVGGIQIATYTGGGFGGGNIVFTFDADATPAAVQALMRALSYNNNGGISPTAGARSVTWTLVDGDGNANGGNDTLLIGSTVNVVSINDAPTGTDNTIVINEDATFVLTAGSFGFGDINGDLFAGVVVTTIPVPGTLFYDADGVGGAAAVAVTAGQFISASEIGLGHLYYTPVSNGNGVPFSSFTFQVRDNGGTAAGGVDTDQSPNTLTFDVTAQNDAPVNTVPGTQTINEDASLTLSTGNGNAIQVSDVDATTLTVTLTVLHGTLTIASTLGLTFSGGSDGTADATMTFSGTAAAINAALGSGLTYNPTGNFNGTDAISVVTDDGGQTGAGGAQMDSDSITINITAINDAPVVIGDGTESATTIDEDTPGAGQTIQALFAGQYSDAADNQIPNGGASSPGQFSGIAVTANGSSGATGQWQYFSGGVWTNIGAASDTAAVLLGDPFVTLIRFNPAADFNGPAPTLTVHLIDNSLSFGIVNGQIVNLSGPGATGGTTAYSTGTVVLSETVTAVNDAPVNTVPGAQTINEDASFTLSTGNGNAISVADVDATTVSVTLSVAHGTLTIASTLGLTFSGGSDGTADATMTFSGTAAAINAALGSGLTYNPTANYNGPDAISIATTDGGQSGSGGAGTDNDTVNITINSVNDAPSGADKTVVASEDDPYVFTAADFGFTDPVEGNAFNAISVMTFPANGTLYLDVDGPGGAAPINLSTVGAGVFVGINDINLGHLYFQPDADEYGDDYATFTFKVQDDGGIANGGVDLDPTANTITIDVTADNFVPIVDLDNVAGGVNHAAAFTENGAPVSIGAGISVTDADSVNGDLIESATVTLTDMVAGDMLIYTGPPPPPGITVVVNVMVGSIVVTITGPGTGAQYAALLEDIEYSSINEDPTFGGTDPTRTITVTASDGTNDSAVATTTVTINAIDDAATAKADAFTIIESGTIVAASVFADNGSGADGDPDGPPLTVSAVNGSGASVGTQITLASGALLKLNANGTFDYNPNGAYLPTPVPGSGASNTPGIDSFTYTLAGGNTVTVTITLTGLDTNDLMLGTAGADTLTADGGTDTLQGLGGNDTYYVNSSGHIVLEAVGGGQDVVYASSNYTLTAGQEIEVLSANPLSGVAPLVLTGNGLVNAINGNAGANVLDGGSGGADVLTGGAGNDVYLVDSDDTVTEGAAEGTRDVIYARSSYSLAAGIYVEVLSTISQVATTAINLTGNAFVNEIYGNAGVNILDGRGGADFMIGLGGNDTYYVDIAGDQVIEGAGEGTRDVVYSEVDYTLAAGANVEVLSAISAGATTAMNLAGNALGNEIFGNAGVNVLDGGGGSDYLRGFEGDDTYFVDDSSDIVIEHVGEGRDVVYASGNYILTGAASVEVLSTISQDASTAINLTGNAFAQEIYGNAGANVLNGASGNDFLIGLGGADSYAFTTSIGIGNVDTIVGFDGVGSDGDDNILLDDAIFSTLALGVLDPTAFHVGTAAGDADDRIIYNSATGAIYYDADGNGAGAAIQFATLDGAPSLTSSDFTVI